MLENFRGLKIKGRCFKNETTLNFFPKMSSRLSLVFGRNGSGKTTVSNVFKALSQKTVYAGMERVDLFGTDQNGRSVAIDEEAIKENLFVFNEAYVQDKILIKGDGSGLGAIVLFGEQAELDAQIHELESKLNEANATLQQKLELQAKFDNEKESESPLYYRKRIKFTMKGSADHWGWCHRHKLIHSPRATMPSAKDETVDKILNQVLDVSADECRSRLKEGMKRIAILAKLENAPPLPKIELRSDSEFDEAGFIALLNKKIEEPKVTDRDKLVLDVVKRFGSDWVMKAGAHLNDPSVEYCPYCLRALREGEKTDVITAIENVLSDRVADYKRELSSFSFPQDGPLDFAIKIAPYNDINSDLVEETIQVYSKISESLGAYRGDVAKRLNAIYGEPSFASRSYTEKLKDLQEKILKIEKIRREYEELRKEPERLRNELDVLNLVMAHYESEEDFAAYERQTSAKKKNDDGIVYTRKSIEKLERDINEKEQQKRNVHIAADRVNAALAYIFMTKDRIQLQAVGSDYQILVNGHNVKPLEVSVGERNALAIAYFFTELTGENNAAKVYHKERLVVLDDPISSFDHENKMGVLSYIMFEIENLTCTVYKDEHNEEIRPWTKVICLMHELHAFMALAVNVNSHDKTSLVKIVQNILALDYRRSDLEKLADEKKIDTINEYSRNFEEVYAYAAHPHPQPSLHVGNQTRRILEAYSTFVYREGFEYLFFRQIVKDDDKVRRKRLNAHFRAVFSRFVVNDESHLQGRVRTLTNANVLFPFINDTERQNAIRDSICLLYLINPAHINSLTKDDNLRKMREEQIKQWIEDILTRSPATGDETNEA